jgi:hypothetical protein
VVGKVFAIEGLFGVSRRIWVLFDVGFGFVEAVVATTLWFRNEE